MRFCYPESHIAWTCVAVEAPTHAQVALKTWELLGFLLRSSNETTSVDMCSLERDKPSLIPNVVLRKR